MEANCTKNMEREVNCSKGKVVETNCSKYMEREANCTKNMEREVKQEHGDGGQLQQELGEGGQLQQEHVQLHQGQDGRHQLQQDQDPYTIFVSGSTTLPAARAQALFAMPEARVRALSTPTPKIPLIWSQQGSSFRAMATPDMGTTLTVMSSSFAPKVFTVASTWRLTAADGRQIDPSREATLRVARRPPRMPQQGDHRAPLLRPARRRNPPGLVRPD